MKKSIFGNKKFLITLGIIILLSGGAWYSGKSYYNFNKKSLEGQTTEPNKEDETGKDNKKPAEETKDEEENKKITYEITKLNKKDGDLFSLPDEVTFTISPTVDKSKITLTNTEGAILYTGETENSEAKFTVYPGKKAAEGSQGILLIEGFVGDEVVVFQKVKVLF